METMPPPPPPPPPHVPPGDPNIIPPTDPKDPILILILAVFLHGIAYFVIGQWQKGLAAVAAWLCTFVIVIITCGLGIAIYLPLHVAVVIDAYMQADLLRKGHSLEQWTFFGNPHR
jgi:hypothetical protein